MTIPATVKGILLMSVVISIGLSELGQRTIASWQGSRQRVAEALDVGMTRVLVEAENEVKRNWFTGKPSPGDGRVGTRTGDLRQDITHERTGPLSGVVGTTPRTSHYARTVLGAGTTTIRPVNAKHLWIPIDKNLTQSGIARYTPRALFDQFQDRVKIFKSKAGNLVVFVEDPRNADGTRARFKRNTKGGRKMGDLKGQLMFVLKDEVRIEGTDALAKGVEAIAPLASEILTNSLREALL